MREVVLSFIFLALISLPVDSARALDPARAPGGNFDLSHWYLQLPTSGGVLTGTAGSVDSASGSQLAAGFTNAYFLTATDGAMAFWVPDDGAKTSGSSHPRSELREELLPGNTGVNWTLYGTHILTATCVVSNVPADTEKVCIGQIHEPDTKPNGTASTGNEQMIMFDLASQTIYANINLDGNLSSSFSQTFISGPEVALGKPVNYTMAVFNGVLQIIVNNVTNSWNLFSGTNYNGHIAQNWDAGSSNTVYFKAGDYNQTGDACGCSNDGARVSFYSLNRYHAPSITNQPAGTNSLVGGNPSFSVAATGNGSLGYQWYFNGTIALAGATNFCLSLTNVQTANAGNYTVVVTDFTGSVTSTVASLTLGGSLPPVISSLKMPVGQGSLTLAATGAASQAYVLLMASNLVPPVTWVPLLTNAANPVGAISFTTPKLGNASHEYYRLALP